MKFRLTSEHYILPVAGSDTYALYFPHKFLLLKINSKGKSLIDTLKEEQFVSDDMVPSRFLDELVHLGVVNGKPDKLPADNSDNSVLRTSRGIFLISEACNLNCRYCYGSSTPSGEKMDLDTVKASVDFLVRNAIKYERDKLWISFNGGGEPTTNWEVLTGSIEYARSLCRTWGIPLISVLVTNGVINDFQREWIARNVSSITVSMDGPPKIQNEMRPMAGTGNGSYVHVEKTLDFFMDAGKEFKVRITCSGDNINSLPENAVFMADRFKPVSILAEPLHVCGRCLDTSCYSPAAKEFIEGFRKARELTHEFNVPIVYSGGRIDYYDDKFCEASGNSFCVNPRGEVTACIEYCRNESRASDPFHYGFLDIESGQFVFEKEKLKYLSSLKVTNFPECSDCFAKWHCCGDCLVKVPNPLNIHGERNPLRCKINKALIMDRLLEKLE